MVQNALVARFRVDDSASVAFESSGACGNHGGRWSFEDRLLQGLQIFIFNIDNLAHRNFAACSVIARLGSLDIRIVSFELKTLSDEVLHGPMRRTTVATVALSSAVNKLLLRKRKKFPRPMNLVVAFQTGHRSKGPARSTSSLVFDMVNGALVSPISGRWHLQLLHFEWLLGFGVKVLVLNAAEVHSLKFSIGECRELVVANGEGVARIRVDFVDFAVRSLENSESEFVLFFGPVRDSVLRQVLSELIFKSLDIGGPARRRLKAEVSHGCADMIH